MSCRSVISPTLRILVGSRMIQSAFARYVLNRQLLVLALLNPSEHGRTEMDVVFNDGARLGWAFVSLLGR
jgi:hypothetical protein